MKTMKSRKLANTYFTEDLPVAFALKYDTAKKKKKKKKN